MDKASIYKKLLTVQTQMEALKKDQSGFNYKYFDINQILEQILPLLQKEKLLLLQPLTNIDGQPAIQTIIVDTESGDTMESTTPLSTYKKTIEGVDKKGVSYIEESGDPQKDGSAITYYRRYALQSMLSLQAEDDDGAKAKLTTQASAPAKSDQPTRRIDDGDLASLEQKIANEENKYADASSCIKAMRDGGIGISKANAKKIEDMYANKK